MDPARPATARLAPELQAEYQEIYNDPARRGTPAWQIAAKGLVAAGLVQPTPDDHDLETALKAADGSTDQQTL